MVWTTTPWTLSANVAIAVSLDITYTKEGYDCWAKDTKIPLDGTDLNLGLRLFIKRDRLSAQELYFRIDYRSQDDGFVGECTPGTVRRDMGNNWEELKIDNLFKRAKKVASRGNWNTKDMVMDRVIIDTCSISGKFYVDEVELFLTK